MKRLLSICFALIATIQLSIAQSDLVINEIMYNPPEAGTDSLEFIEIYNKGSIAINVNNYTCTGGNYTFPNTSIAPGSYYVIAVNMVAFNNVYGLPADGQFTNGLNNSGESIVLKDGLGNVLDSVFYDDISPWPSGSSAGNPDGGGASIILCNDTSDNNLGSNWSASVNNTGATINGFPVLASPGVTNSCSGCMPTYGIDALTACDSLTWTNGVTYYANNFTAKDTLVNAAGCDSIVTLDLAINYSNSATDVRTECDSLLWIDGITYFTNNSTATYTLTNQTGCDSVITLNLTITGNSSTSTDFQSACDSLIWIDGNTYYSNNNTATYIVSNTAGCDSIITLNLTINNSYTIIDSITACDSLTWINGITYYTSNNTASDTLTSVSGCDSIVNLNLTLGITPEVTLNAFNPDTVCLTDNPYSLPTATPLGGVYSGNGVAGGMFDPSIAGVGVHTVYYNVTDLNSCTGVDSTTITVETCTGLNTSFDLNKIVVQPNPTNKDITIDLNTSKNVSIEILNTLGQVVTNLNYLNTQRINLELGNMEGIYFIRLTIDNAVKVIKVLKQ